MIIVHRGATSIAPENTIEAYAAAMDLGADGCEVDLRLTRDGVIVMFHDDMLDHLTESLGDISELTFNQTQRLKHRLSYGRKLPTTAPPTFIALLELARQRSMLLHLDVKVTGMDGQIIRLLDDADMWDHIIALNSPNAPQIARHPKLRLLKYRGGLYENRLDVDPQSVRALLPGAGEMVIVDDPRLVASLLHRTALRPEPLPPNLCDPLGIERAELPPVYEGTNFNLFAYTQKLGRLSEGEALLVMTREFPEHNRPSEDVAAERKRTELIVQRAWAAQNVTRSWTSPRTFSALRNLVRTRSLHQNWRFHGLDGAAAIRALARLNDTGAVPTLIDAFVRVDPELSRVAAISAYGDYPLSWQDAVFKMYVMPALGELRTPLTRSFLREYLALDEPSARRLSPPQWEEATKALLKQKLSRSELQDLLLSTNSAVKGTVVLELLDRHGGAGRDLLRHQAPWAAELPSARQ